MLTINFISKDGDSTRNIELSEDLYKWLAKAENYRLWKLQDLLKCVENEKYQYFQRV